MTQNESKQLNKTYNKSSRSKSKRPVNVYVGSFLNSARNSDEEPLWNRPVTLAVLLCRSAERRYVSPPQHAILIADVYVALIWGNGNKSAFHGRFPTRDHSGGDLSSRLAIWIVGVEQNTVRIAA